MEMRWSVKMAEYLMKNRRLFGDRLNFSDALMSRAFIEVSKAKGDISIQETVKRYADLVVSSDGRISDIDFTDERNIAAGILFIDMYRLTREEKFKKASYFIWDNIKKYPRTAEGVFYSEKNREYISTEGLYYISGFYAGHISAFKYIKKYGDIIRQFMVVYNNLKDEKTGLLHNAYDRTKNMPWCSRKTGFSPCFYAPITARFIVSLVDFIFCLDYSAPDSKKLINIFRNLLDNILKYKAQNGCFYLIIDEEDRCGNFAESYSTIMILYAIAKGINKNILFDEKYMRAADEIYNGIIDEFLTISPNGNININKICCPKRFSDDLSFSYYICSPVISNENDTLAIFILAMCEYEKIKRS